MEKELQALKCENDALKQKITQLVSANNELTTKLGEIFKLPESSRTKHHAVSPLKPADELKKKSQPESSKNDLTTTNETSSRKSRLPKIAVSGVKDFKLFSEKIIGKVGSDNVIFKAINSGEILIAPNTPEVFREITQCICEMHSEFANQPNHGLHGITYFTYKLKEEKSYQVVVRGLPLTTDVNEIASELSNMGHKVIKGHQHCKNDQGT